MALGLFAFLVVFHDGAENLKFLSEFNLTTDAMLNFIGSALGVVVSVVFAVMFIRASVRVKTKRFFPTTKWILVIVVAQLLVKSYHEFSEVNLVAATPRSMAVLGPIVRNNSVFVLAILAMLLVMWLREPRQAVAAADGNTMAERRLALARMRREYFYRRGAVGCTLLVLLTVGLVYARDIVPKKLPAPELVAPDGDFVSIPVSKLDDGKLHRLGFLSGGKLVRFLAMKPSDGKIRTALDACEICGSLGYIQDDKNLVCLNCAAEINPLTLNAGGGCNPIPLESEVTPTQVRIRVSALERGAYLFTGAEQAARTEIDPICGMRVRMSEAAAFQDYKGKIFYFCSERCRTLFNQEKSGAGN